MSLIKPETPPRCIAGHLDGDELTWHQFSIGQFPPKALPESPKPENYLKVVPMTADDTRVVPMTADDNVRVPFSQYVGPKYPDTFTKYPDTNELLKGIKIQPIPSPVDITLYPAQKLSEATKYDADKTDWSLMPWAALEEINKVLDFGAKKYSEDNWAENGGFKYRRIFRSLMRHLTKWFTGEDKDPETGLSHLAHAGCNILFLLHYVINKEQYKDNDNRPFVKR